jgi:hypothetical protein
MFFKKKITNTIIIPIFIFFFALLFNQYFGNQGIFPIDSFSHFDTGFRVLNGEHPFKDYWIVSGPIIDYLQGLIFLFFDVSWQTYLLNASLLNAFLSVATYKLLNNFSLRKKYSFFYTICLSILAYPTSGTPFVDHHSTFFSIIAIYFLILGMLKEKKVYWFFLPIFVVLGFLSKQVPSTYIFFSILIVLFYHFTTNSRPKNLEIILTLSISTFLILISILIFFYLNDIKVQSFIDQYINYPREIGSKRYIGLNYDFKNIFLDFKFIYLFFFILAILNIYKTQSIKNFYKSINFKLFLIFFFLLISLIHHQILTKNQIYIFFLIPLFAGFAHIELIEFRERFYKSLSYLLIIICLFSTYKYHNRFNKERKFHELNNTNPLIGMKADLISKKFKGLTWFTPNKNSRDEILNEINEINEIKNILRKDKNKKMIITNYSIFSVLTNSSQNGFSRWYPQDDSAFPQVNSKFYYMYKNFIIKNINEKKIVNIYIVSDVSDKNLLNYVEASCFNKTIINKQLTKYNIVPNCSDLASKK